MVIMYAGLGGGRLGRWGEGWAPNLRIISGSLERGRAPQRIGPTKTKIVLVAKILLFMAGGARRCKYI